MMAYSWSRADPGPYGHAGTSPDGYGEPGAVTVKFTPWNLAGLDASMLDFGVLERLFSVNVTDSQAMQSNDTRTAFGW